MLLLLWTQQAYAEQGTSRVDVPLGCGSVEEFQAEVEHRLGAGLQVPLQLLSIVRERSGQFRLNLQVGDEARELRDADCRELFRAAVVVAVATTLTAADGKSEAADGGSWSMPDPTMLPPPAAAALPSAEPAPVPSAEEGPSIPLPPADPSSQPLGGERPSEDSRAEPLAAQAGTRFGGAFGVGMNVGLQPAVALAFELEGRSLWGQFGVALAGRYLISSSERDDQGRGVSIDTWGAQVAGLYRPAPRWEMRIGTAGYRLFGHGIGTASDRAGGAWSLGPCAGVAFVPLVHAFMSLALGGDVHWNAMQPRFDVLNHGNVFSSSLFDFSIFLRVGPRSH